MRDIDGEDWWELGSIYFRMGSIYFLNYLDMFI